MQIDKEVAQKIVDHLPIKVDVDTLFGELLLNLNTTIDII